MGWFSSLLKTIERVVVITAATLAVFPLWQYWSEAEDRARERVVQEMQLAVSCISMKNEMAGRLESDLKGVPIGEQAKIVEAFEKSWTREHALVARCMRIGAISESG